MKLPPRVLISAGCLFAAIGFYAFGVQAGGMVFLVLGIGFEGLFWIGVFGRKKEPATNP